MLLQAFGAAVTLRSSPEAEVDRGLGLLGLADALPAAYPSAFEEKRHLDAKLLAVPT